MFIWSVDSQLSVPICCHQMASFKAKMHQIQFQVGFSTQLETETISQKKLYSHPLLNPSGTTSHHKLPPGYSTSTGERESRPFREEPWHLHYVSWLSMHSMHSALPTCQPLFMVSSLQLVEVRPYSEEEEDPAGGAYSTPPDAILGLRGLHLSEEGGGIILPISPIM